VRSDCLTAINIEVVEFWNTSLSSICRGTCRIIEQMQGLIGMEVSFSILQSPLYTLFHNLMMQFLLLTLSVKNLDLTGIRSPYRPACSESLCRPSYFGPQIRLISHENISRF
jgi:hypothetical protein